MCKNFPLNWTAMLYRDGRMNEWKNKERRIAVKEKKTKKGPQQPPVIQHGQAVNPVCHSNHSYTLFLPQQGEGRQREEKKKSTGCDHVNEPACWNAPNCFVSLGGGSWAPQYRNGIKINRRNIFMAGCKVCELLLLLSIEYIYAAAAGCVITSRVIHGVTCRSRETLPVRLI